MLERRRFLAKASGAAAVAATLIADAPTVIAQPKVQWRLSTAWPPQLDNLQGSAQRLAQVVEEMSGGRFRIEVFPGGQIMQPFECFDATSKGTIERGVIDACEWVGPHDDLKLGLQNTARYYYYPGWHEPGTVAEFG